MSFISIEEALEVIRNGEMLIVLDDDSRENEGDLIMAAQWVTPQAVNFMATHARGLICAPLAGDTFKRLKIPMMVDDQSNHSPFATPFGVSVEARNGVTTGISAQDRAKTLRVLADPGSTHLDITLPGHIFPLRARKGGVLERAGHTEAAVDLTRLAGLTRAGVICEIMNEDGTMARRTELEGFSSKHGIPMMTIADLIEYRRYDEKENAEPLLELFSEAKIPTSAGFFNARVYREKATKVEHIALFTGKMNQGEPLVRVHSECLTGDVFGSLRCDCGDQLQLALRLIHEEGSGALIYLRQEGRGIGLGQKIKAYALQQEGMDTVEANLALGFPEDMRSYEPAAEILKDLGISKLKLLTNNPLKVEGVEAFGIRVVQRVPVMGQVCASNHFYLKTKMEKMGHLLSSEEIHQKPEISTASHPHTKRNEEEHVTDVLPEVLAAIY
jgi:3,4-dihydroxy 2-butanone 4-phosphate synthase/GTP cyclohydrolase II